MGTVKMDFLHGDVGRGLGGAGPGTGRDKAESFDDPG